MPASALELYQGGSLFYLADILTKAIDALVADPFGYLGDVLPDLAYTYGEVGSGLKALLDMLASSGLDLGVICRKISAALSPWSAPDRL